MAGFAIEPWHVYGLVFAAMVALAFAVRQIAVEANGGASRSRFGVRLVAGYRARRRKREFDGRILDLTMGLANAMKAGMALAQALEKVSEQLGGVMREEISVVLRDYRLGMGITDAMERLVERMPSEDMRLLSSAIRLTTQTGGSLVDVMAQLVDTIRNRTEFHQKLRTLTAQGRFEAMAMASAPLLAFLLLYFCQPDLMRPLVTTTTGWIAIGVVVALEAVGFLVIRKIVTIEV